MDIKKYIANPTVIEAALVTENNLEKVANWCNGAVKGIKLSKADRIIQWHNKLHDSELEAKVGEYIVKGVHPGDFYPCNAEVFKEKYIILTMKKEK